MDMLSDVVESLFTEALLVSRMTRLRPECGG
jgi:hypothetical protein